MDISQFFIKTADLEALMVQASLPCQALSDLTGGQNVGFPVGKLVEMQGAHGSGKTETLLRFFQENSSLQIAWIEVGATIYPCSFSERGVDLSRVLFVEAKDASEALWSAHQMIKSQLFGAVILSQLDSTAVETQVTPHTTTSRPRDSRSFELRGPKARPGGQARIEEGFLNEIELRRLQIAAEKSKGMVFFLNENPITQESWPIEMQIKFSRSAAQDIQVEILKARRGQWKQAVRNIG